jgi:hypothetical protein
MTVKLRFASLLLVLLAPIVLGASPAPPADACSSVPLLQEILSPAAQPSAAAPEGLSPLDGASSATCSALDCAAQCDPCGWKFYGCYEGEALCACRIC